MHSTVRISMWSASSSAGGRVCGVIASSWSQGPIVRASRTRTQPEGVFQVVTSTFVPGSYGPCGRMRDPERAEPEEPCLPVEQAAEHARRVERGDAEPVDRAVGRDERSRVAVGEERVVGDRRKRRRRCRALRLGLGGVGGRRGGHRAPLRSRSRDRASGRGRRPARPPQPVPTTPARRCAREADRRAAAA